MRWAGRTAWMMLALLCWPVFADAQDEAEFPAAEVEFFEKHIRPVLVERCYECHGESNEPDGGLRLDSRAGWLHGGASGPAIVPGKPEESRLLAALQYSDPELQMPPEGRLPAAVVARFEQWIARGAIDPRAGERLERKPAALDLAAARQHWSYQLPRDAAPPAVSDTAWPRNDIDRFILARLEAAGLSPATDASREALVRRLHFDLTGLGPLPEDIDAFLADTSADAYERLVERLLASPRFGERWGRHWLDVVRFGESLTLRGFILPEAWRYRDYVIDAFNRDRSYQQLVREQIAGDLLTATDLAERQRQVVATTYLALGNTNLEEQDKQQLEMDFVDEQLDTIGRSLLAQTVGCARCHDHKFDPIPTRDYYALAGILHSAQALEHANVSKWIEVPLPLAPQDEELHVEHEAHLTTLEQRIKERRESLAKLEKGGPPVIQPHELRGSDEPSESSAVAALRGEIQALEGELKQLRTRGPVRPRVLSVRETGTVTETRVHIRGSVHNLGEVVPRGFLQVANYDPPVPMPAAASGRRELAEWLASHNNPLTARVFTNRVWHWLMGAGLVRTPDNLGTTGEPPTHPELLDHLTLEFIASGWSPKHLIRTIVLSRTYRLAATAPPQLVTADPDNRLWGRALRRRLDAEALRDQILQLSGSLDLAMGGSTIRPGTEADYGYDATESRRSVYVPVLRNALPEIFEVFDFADPSVATGRRSRTTAVPQALLVLNHPFFHAEAQRTAERVLNSDAGSDEQRLRALFRQALGRAPTEGEAGLARDFLAGSAEDPVAGWTGLVHALMGSVDFRFLD